MTRFSAIIPFQIGQWVNSLNKRSITQPTLDQYAKTLTSNFDISFGLHSRRSGLVSHEGQFTEVSTFLDSGNLKLQLIVNLLNRGLQRITARLKIKNRFRQFLMTTIEYFFSSRLKIDFPSSESTKLEFKNEIQTRQVGLNFFSRAKQKFFPLEPVQGFNGCLHFPYHLLWPTNYIISRHYFLLL